AAGALAIQAPSPSLPSLVTVPARDEASPPSRGMGNLLLAAGYIGNSSTRTANWRSAFALEAGWRPIPNLTLGIGYEIAPPDTTGTGAMTFRFQRHPVFAGAGYRF